LEQTSQPLFTIEPFSESAHADLWDSLCLDSEFGWCWHSRLWKKFILETSSEKKTIDLSFVVFHEGKAVGLCSLLVLNLDKNDIRRREASYAGGGLPWPCIDPSYTKPAELLLYIFEKAEEIAASNGAQYIKFTCSSPTVTNTGMELVYSVMIKRNYMDSGFDSSLVDPQHTDINTIRERYKRYIKKFEKNISIEIVAGNEVTGEIEEAYFLLHVKDAGKQYRSRLSYQTFCDIARKNEAFLVVAKEKNSQAIVGILIVSLVKNAAYDSSVAVDPDYADQYVSHLLKWGAIQYLKNCKVSHYELGEKKLASKIGNPVSVKEYGITNFKEGWARGLSKRVTVAEKYLDKDMFDLCMENMKQSMAAFWFEKH
jgi:hypothetical protein